MQIEELKKEWKSIKTPEIDIDRLRDMTVAKSHPVLSGLRKQFTIELIGWSVFLVVCFTGLDADKKPILANAAIIISVTLPMILNVYGYQLSKELVEGPDICSSLRNRINSLRRFAVVSVILRIMLIAGLGYFFLSSIKIDQRKLMLAGAGGVVFIFQLYLLARVWAKRIGKLRDTLSLLE